MLRCIFEDGNEASLRHVVVDGLLVRDGKILLVKRAKKLLEGGKWALVGGFVERDETIQEAMAREAHEETGYEVLDSTLLRIIDNPNRPGEDRQTVAFVYVCTVGEKTGESDWESDEQKWFDLSALPDEKNIAFDHYEDIQFYLQNRHM